MFIQCILVTTPREDEIAVRLHIRSFQCIYINDLQHFSLHQFISETLQFWPRFFSQHKHLLSVQQLNSYSNSVQFPCLSPCSTACHSQPFTLLLQSSSPGLRSSTLRYQRAPCALIPLQHSLRQECSGAPERGGPRACGKGSQEAAPTRSAGGVWVHPGVVATTTRPVKAAVGQGLCRDSAAMAACSGHFSPLTRSSRHGICPAESHVLCVPSWPLQPRGAMRLHR